ncbi:hypothetical protein C8F01DRAFT_470763 [Mycena amicta]|nr:hypothetical protein C8F01DRAFT_470763 [Mycena amicta]
MCCLIPCRGCSISRRLNHDFPAEKHSRSDMFHLFPMVPNISADDFYGTMAAHCCPESLTLGGSVLEDPYGSNYYLSLRHFKLERLKSYTVIVPKLYKNTIPPDSPWEDALHLHLPCLATISAPFLATCRLIPLAPLVEQVAIPDRFQDTRSAVGFIESLIDRPLRIFALSLATWDVSVLERISNTLPHLHKLEILYYAEGNLDLRMVENALRKLHNLTTFHLGKLPPPSAWEAYFPDEDFDSLEEVEPATIYEEPGAFPQYTAEANFIKRWGCADVAPALVRVQLGLEPGQVWVRSPNCDWRNLWEERIGWSVREEGKWGCVRQLGKYMRRALHEPIDYANWL